MIPVPTKSQHLSEIRTAAGTESHNLLQQSPTNMSGSPTASGADSSTKGTNGRSGLSRLTVAGIVIGTFIASILVCLVVVLLIRTVRRRAVMEEPFLLELDEEEPNVI
jgi:hypothetical protein